MVSARWWSNQDGAALSVVTRPSTGTFCAAGCVSFRTGAFDAVGDSKPVPQRARRPRPEESVPGRKGMSPNARDVPVSEGVGQASRRRWHTSVVPDTARLPLSRWRLLPRRLVQFALLELACCAFAIAIFVGLAASALIWKYTNPPIARYDALLIYVVVVQIAFVALKQETWRELGVICAFHLIGLALEVFKVHTGSWAYPDAGVVRVGGVPVFSGFMYASVGSYICQAFRRLDLHVGGFRWWPVSLLAVAAYLNFFTHHVIVDLRWVIAAGFLIALWGSAVHFTVGGDRYWMPTTVAFILIGGFLWLAENLATALSAWRYPNQADGWHLVHAGKFGSWALLISLSFVLVAAVKAKEGTLYGRGLPRVTRRRLRIAET